MVVVPAYLFASSVTYVTGSHELKSGVQWGPGHDNWEWRGSNADLTQRYRNGVPDSVIVYNTPTASRNSMNADLGIYVQDSPPQADASGRA